MRRLAPDEVRRLVASGRLGRWQVYALEHQHPLNQLTHFVGIPLILFASTWPFWRLLVAGEFPWGLWVGGNVVGWALQLLGHRIEGNRPAFAADPWQLAIGPLFFLAKPWRWLRGLPPVALDPDVLAACGVALEPAPAGAAGPEAHAGAAGAEAQAGAAGATGAGGA